MEANPYAAPEAKLDEVELVPTSGGDLAAFEAIRRKHIAAESSVKALGGLNILGGALLVLAGFSLFAAGFVGERPAVGLASFSGFLGVAVFATGALNLAVGLGLRGLRSWARWVTIALLSISLLLNLAGIAIYVARGGAGGSLPGTLFGMIIPGYLFSLLISRRAAVVFSPEYAEVIAATPHVKMKTSWLVKGFAIVLVAVIVIGVVAALLGSIGNHG